MTCKVSYKCDYYATKARRVNKQRAITMSFKKQNDDGIGIWVQDPVWRKGDRRIRYVCTVRAV